ncbi:hypothetical protein [Lactiplantibacillus paraxiangfangensis]|uniref:hypothetical protein n=1 Tax=Lactiplantibacillus paraxiangfangensis TaxID=3076224 RepID=UPI0030C768C6
MWKHRFMIKGSKEELAWLNREAKRHYLLVGIWNSWYHFKRVTTTYQIFSEYVSTDFVPELAKANQQFKVLATYEVSNPDIQVVYTGTDQAVVTKVLPGDPQMRLKVGLRMRDQAMNTVNVVLYSAVAFLGIVMFLVLNIDDANRGENAMTIWFFAAVIIGVVVFRLYRAAKQLQDQIVILRRDTENYDGAWMPTMHVFIDPLTTDLDTEALKSLGRWSLVNQTSKGAYWYDLQTLASASDIKASLKPYTTPTTHVSVVSWLGLAPLGWFM